MAKVTVRIPLALLKLSGGLRHVELEAADVNAALHALDERFPGCAARIYDEAGRPLRHVNIYVNKVDVRRLEGHATRLGDGDEIAVLPAIGGG